MTKRAFLILASVFLLAFTVVKSYEYTVPSHFPSPKFDFKNTPLVKEKVELGRALFYDPILSKDKTISCASCHSPYNSFAHTDHRLSHGIFDSIGKRNAPALFNLAWQNSFMHDGAINHIEKQALAPLLSETEMGGNLDTVISRLSKSPMYTRLFQEAFGTTIITGEFFLKALAQFQLSLLSANSKYDKVKLKKEVFNEQEQKGYELFKNNCNSCHQEPLFSTYEFASNGLTYDTLLNDEGRFLVTHINSDKGLFKIPSLRNLTYSYPYMHDGRFNSLKEVLNHYTNGEIKQRKGNQNLIKNIVLNDYEKVDLLAFLLTLNDQEFIFNKKNKYPREILLNN